METVIGDDVARFLAHPVATREALLARSVPEGGCPPLHDLAWGWWKEDVPFPGVEGGHDVVEDVDGVLGDLDLGDGGGGGGGGGSPSKL